MAFRRRIPTVSGGGPALDPEYVLLLLIAIGLGFGLPDPPTQLKQNQIIVDLKTSGAWNFLDALWVPRTANPQFATLNWKNPSAHQAIANGGLAFTPNQGFDPDGVGSYLDLNWIPSVDGVNFQQNNASVLFASTTDANLSVNDRCLGAWDLTRAVQLVPRHGVDQASYSLNDGTFVPGSGTVPDSSGIFQLQRTSAPSSRLYRNGVLVGTTAAPSNGRPTVSVYAGAVNFNGVPLLFSQRNIGLVAFGSGMAGLEASIATAWNNYITP